MGFKDYLAEMNDSWTEGKDTPPGIPDGDYPMRLIKCVVHQSKSSKNYSLLRTHLVLEGEYAGEEVTDFVSLSREGWMFHVSQFIRSVGFEPPATADELEETFAAIEAAQPCYMASVKAGKDTELRNVNIKEQIEDPGTDVVPAAAAPKATAKPAAGKPVAKPAAKAPVKKAPAGPPVGTIVQFAVEGNDAERATVTGHGDGVINVETDAGDAYELSEGEYTIAPEAEAEPSDAAQVQAEDDDSETIAGIVAIFQANGIECPETPTLEDLKTIAKDYDFQRNELTEDEVTLLGTIEASIIEPEPVKKPVAKPAAKPAAPAAKAPVKPVAKAPAKPAAKAPAKKK